jgi:hypothetical protein
VKEEPDEILDDPFHAAAFAAFVDEMLIANGPPCPKQTQQRAYRYYEEALAEKNRGKESLDSN